MSQALLLAAGLLGSWLVARWGPLAPADPLRTTLIAVPLVIGALLWIERRSVALGGRRIATGVSTWQGIAGLALVAATLLRTALAADLPAGPLFAAWVLLLAHRVAHQVVALRPLLGKALPRRPSLLFFLLPLVVYGALIPWSTHHRPPDGDEPFYLLITHSLTHDFDADLTNNYQQGDWRFFMDRPLEPQPGDPVGPNGELYSRHNEALPMLLVPAYALGGRLGALGAMAALTAALAWLTLRVARHYAPAFPGETLLAWSLLAFAPPLLLYSYQVWVEVPAALLGLIALDWIHDGRGRPWKARRWLLLALPLMLLPLLKIRFMLLAAPLLALGWWYSGRRLRPAIILGGALGALGVGILIYNQWLYGNPLKIHTWGELEPTRYGLIEYLKGSSGLFWDCAFGLIACAPLWGLLVPAILRRRRQPGDHTGRLFFDLVAFTAPYLLIVVPRSEWYGGWSPPFRYALVALPLLALALAPLLAERRRGGSRALITALGLGTVALTLCWLVVPGWTYNVADGRNFLLDAFANRTGLDLARFFPSSIRPRWATWLWPSLGALALWLGWQGPRRLRRAPLWGAAASLGLVAGLWLAAERLPTTTVQFEDHQVAKSGGHVFPDRWVIERRRFTGGWTLREGETVTAPVIAGSGAASLRLHLQFVRNKRAPLDLEIRAGDQLLETWRARHDRRWSWVEVGPFEWPEGAPLVIAARLPKKRGRPNGVVLDRAELHWW
ncbi:MAG: hypothetical protein AAF604_21715 [Acidobacteriota bacterium]